MLIHIQASAQANCNTLDATLILTVDAGTKNKRHTASSMRKMNIVKDIEMDHDCIHLSLSKYISGAGEYISGYVANKVQNYVGCSVCKEFFIKNSDDSSLPLIKRKQWVMWSVTM